MKRTRTPSKTPEAPDQIVQQFLESRSNLLQRDLEKASGIRIAQKYADLMDRFIRSLFLQAGFRDRMGGDEKDALAVLALGSYGRRELCLGSDVDLLVVHEGRLSPQMQEMIPRAIYPLWDARLEVGHAIMTIPECLRLAVHDFRVLSSLLDARFLMGTKAFWRLFEAAFWSRIDREKKGLLTRILSQHEKRIEKYGKEEHFLEPDIKEGLGGLRDLHSMAWIARVYFKSKTLRALRRFAAFAHLEVGNLGVSRSFLLRVRNQLHLLAGRKEDRVLLTFQKDLSERLGYEDGPRLPAAERFLRDLYQHLNRIRYVVEEFHVKALDLIEPVPLDAAPPELPPQLQVLKGNIVLKKEGVLFKDPLLILHAFDEARRRGFYLGSGFIWEAREALRGNASIIRESPEARELFMNLIVNPSGPKLTRLALEIGLMSLFIPEFKRIRNLAQFGFYHVKTVDLHSLGTLEVVHEMAMGRYDERWPLFREVLNELEKPAWLSLAALLHDIGKGYIGDHSERGAELAPKILEGLGVSGRAVGVIAFLIQHHVLLTHVSQRRDLAEEKTSVQVAQTVKDPELLRMLFLLTAADSLSTGPMARSDWKIMLLTELFFKVSRILKRGILASPDATEKIEEKKKRVMEALCQDFAGADIRFLTEQVSSRYILNTPVEDICLHFRLALEMGSQPFSWSLIKLKDAPVTKVLQCIHDRPGLFSRLVGVFTLNDIKVLSANIFTLKNGLAFDTYEVTNPLDPYREEERWDKVREDLLSTIEDRLDLDERIRSKGEMALDRQVYEIAQAPQVKIDNEISDFFTVIEVNTGDRVGILYDLAKELSGLQLDIRFARVNSDEERMNGVFYVRTAEGQKVQEEKDLERIREGLRSVMGGGHP